MKFHSDVLTTPDLYAALEASGLAREGVYLIDVSKGRSRKRARRIEAKLAARAGSDRKGVRRRWANSGSHGAASSDPFVKAATYDEWGWWLAELFERDPKLIANEYDGRERFHEMTEGKYARVAR